MNSSFWQRYKVVIVILLLLLLGGVGFYLFERLGAKDIELTINPPAPLEVGQPFDLEVKFVNHSSKVLRNVRLVLNLPDNLLAVDEKNERSLVRPIGDIASGGNHQEIFKLIATPGFDPNYKINLSAYYSPVSVVADFRKTEERVLEVKRPEAEIQLLAPERVFPGEEMRLELSYKKGGGSGAVPMRLRLHYPDGFYLVGAEPKADESVNIWNLNLAEGKIIVRGTAQLPENSSFNLEAELTMKIMDEDYPFVKAARSIVLNPSPLAFRVSLADGREVVQPGDQLNYLLVYKNNTEVPFQNIVIKTQLIGEMFDFDSLESNADFNRLTHTLTWDFNKFSDLKNLAPGAEGQVGFSVRVKNDYPIKTLSDKNFVLRLNSSIESPTVPYLIEVSKTVNTNILETKVAGRAELKAVGYFRDAPAGILNHGPFPPKVGTPTNFTIHWILGNFANDLSEVRISAKLGDGVSFTGQTKSNLDSAPQFDSTAREVVWQINRLPAAAGLFGSKPEAVFQVEALPPPAAAGQYLLLLGPAELRAKDEFTGLEVRATAGPVTTELPDDPTVKPGEGLVR